MAFSTQEYDAVMLKVRRHDNGSVKEAEVLIAKLNREKPDGYKALVKELKRQAGYAKIAIPKKNW